MVSDLHCLLHTLYSVNKPVVTDKNVTFIKQQSFKSNKEKSFANQIHISSNKIAASEGKSLFVENKVEDRVY